MLVSASAIGYYGYDRGEESLTEDSERGDGFLADVVADWEDATAPAEQAGTRVVRVRTGIVQSPAGGTLRLLRPLFAAGLGGRLGSGQQWFSWIGIDDLVDIYHRALWDQASCPGRSTRWPPNRSATSTTPTSWLMCCAGPRSCRCRRWGPRCSSATRARANSPWPTSGCCPRGCYRQTTASADLTWSRLCGICWVVS